jgi:hypothetical protein
MKELSGNRLRFRDRHTLAAQDDQSGSLFRGCRTLAEIALVFAVFFIQGAWPVPDVNEPYYVGKAIHYWNAAWSAGDFFLDSKDTHHVFYLTFGWLSRYLTPAAFAWTGRIVTWWLLAWSWRRLSFAVLPRTGWSILTAALFAMLMENFHMAGEWVIGGLEAKGFAYVLVLLGLEALVWGRWHRVWLFFGAASALHVLVGGWAAIAALLAWLIIGSRRPKLRSLLPSILGGFVLALPGLLPAIALNTHVDAETIRQANQIYVFDRFPHHLDIFHIYPQFIVRFAFLTLLYFALAWRVSLISGVVAIGQFAGTVPIFVPTKMGLSLSSRFRGVAPNDASGDVRVRIRQLRAFITAAIIIALAGVCLNFLAFVDRGLAAGLLRYYWFRLADVAVPLGVAMLGCWWIIDAWPRRTATARLAAALVGLALICHFGSLTIDRLWPSAPRAERLADPQSWQQACRWAADERNTPPTARFITPRLAQTFKWYAARPEVVTWKEVPQNAAEIVQWWARLQEAFAAGPDDPDYPGYKSLNDIDEKRIEQLARKYQADFLITENFDPPLNLKAVYQNEGYIIYQIAP